MQLDFFEKDAQPLPDLVLQEHLSPNYSPRTGDNARGADVTVAFAVDFETAGERLTHRVAGARYVGIPFGHSVELAADKLLKFLEARGGNSLNVAGNGIYTLTKKGVTQQQANQWVLSVLTKVHKARPLRFIRSGGQTGVDTAGLVAGLVLGVPVLGLYPQGFKRRLASQQDVDSSPDDLETELRAMAKALHPR